MSTAIQVIHPVTADLRKRLLFVANDTISSLEVDSTNGYLFWISPNGVNRSRLDGTSVNQVVKQNGYVSKITLDRQNRRLVYLEMAGNKMSSVDYDGKDLKTFPRLFSLPVSRPINYESVVIEDGFLYFAAQKQLRRVKLSDGVPQNDTNTLLINLTSNVLNLQSRLKADSKHLSLLISPTLTFKPLPRLVAIVKCVNNSALAEVQTRIQNVTVCSVNSDPMVVLASASVLSLRMQAVLRLVSNDCLYSF